jgi:hypothetical protein
VVAAPRTRGGGATELDPRGRRSYQGTVVAAPRTRGGGATELLERGHGWAATAVGRAVASHTDANIRAHVEAWTSTPVP